MKSKKHFMIFAVSFLQGGCIMGYEILVPKLIAPFFGSSLYVWASSLILTMLGLTSGYFLAGRYHHLQPARMARNMLSLSATLVILSVFMSGTINSALLVLPLKQGIVISAFLHLFPFFTALGMISPLLVSVIGKISSETQGKAAGFVFACSTAAGIAFSMLTGFYLIPETGITITAIVLFFCVSLAALLMHFLSGNEHLQKVEL